MLLIDSFKRLGDCIMYILLLSSGATFFCASSCITFCSSSSCFYVCCFFLFCSPCITSSLRHLVPILFMRHFLRHILLLFLCTLFRASLLTPNPVFVTSCSFAPLPQSSSSSPIRLRQPICVGPDLQL